MQFAPGYVPIWDTWTARERWKFLYRLERMLRRQS